MAKTKTTAAKANKTATEAAAVVALEGAVTAGHPAANDQGPTPWVALRVAVIDDAVRIPQVEHLSEEDAAFISGLLMDDKEIVSELTELGCGLDASANERLRILAKTRGPSVSIARIGERSSDIQRMFEEFRVLRHLIESLEHEVAEVVACDPSNAIPDLATFNLVLIDYYLEGPARGGDLAVSLATTIVRQPKRVQDQQIVLMSSLESVRELRGDFRTRTNVTGSAFAFVSKPDLNEVWKVKAHLGMLERARPYVPAFSQYRSKLDEALVKAKEDLLALVDDLDIGDYAFLQSRALMKDGHPLGDYVFWLLSSQHLSLAFESDEMRERQQVLDRLEFVGEPFAATEPSTIVANLLHSALVSRSIGPLGSHPRAKPNSKYEDIPLVQLGDVFFDADRTKAVVVMSADCDLAFSPTDDRAPDVETPVMLVPGTPIKLKDAKDKAGSGAKTDGIVHREEVYRIVWEFSKYRAVPLGGLEKWLKNSSYDVTNRDRLRPLFGLKLQQEFGAHLLRVGPPIMPPMTTPAKARIFVCTPDRDNVRQLGPKEVMLTRFKGITLLRVTPVVAGALKEACEELYARLLEKREATDEKANTGLDKNLESLTAQLKNDDFWINLLRGVELNAPGSVMCKGPLGFVLGSIWPDSGKPRVVIEIEDVAAIDGVNSDDAPALVEVLPEIGAVSGAA